MTRGTVLLQMILMAAAGGAIAHGAVQSSGSQVSETMLIGPTGTMYDGNNVNLMLPVEHHQYWIDRWAAPMSESNADSGAGTASAGSTGTAAEGH